MVINAIVVGGLLLGTRRAAAAPGRVGAAMHTARAAHAAQHAGRPAPAPARHACWWQAHARRRRSAQAGAAARGEAEAEGQAGEPTRVRVGVLCGGPTLERGISLNSGRSVFDHLNGHVQTLGAPGGAGGRRLRYEVSLYYVNSNKQTCRLDRCGGPPTIPRGARAAPPSGTGR